MEKLRYLVGNLELKFCNRFIETAHHANSNVLVFLERFNRIQLGILQGTYQPWTCLGITK